MNSFGLDLEIGLEASAQSHALAASGRGKGRKRQSHDARAVELAVNAKGVAREREDGVGAGQESGEGGAPVMGRETRGSTSDGEHKGGSEGGGG